MSFERTYSNSTIKTFSHGNWVTQVAWNEDLLATGSLDKTVKLWNTESDSALQSLAHGGNINAIQWAPSEGHMSGYLATACDDGYVRIWLAKDGHEAIKVGSYGEILN